MGHSLGFKQWHGDDFGVCGQWQPCTAEAPDPMRRR